MNYCPYYQNFKDKDPTVRLISQVNVMRPLSSIQTSCESDVSDITTSRLGRKVRLIVTILYWKKPVHAEKPIK